MWNLYHGGFFIFNLKTTKAITIKLSIISFGTNPRIAAKFQTDRFRNFGGYRAEKIYIENTASKPYTVTAVTLRYADAGGINKFSSVESTISLRFPWWFICPRTFKIVLTKCPRHHGKPQEGYPGIRVLNTIPSVTCKCRPKCNTWQRRVQ